MNWNNSSHQYQSPSKYALWSVLFFGALLSFAFAPYKWWPIAFISMAGLLYFLQNISPRAAFKLTWCFAMAMNLPTLWWIHVSMTEFGGIPLPAAFLLVALLCSYLSLYPALAAWLLNRFVPTSGYVRHLLVFPALWLCSDWAIGHILTGFPWMWLGYSQIDNWLIGFAPVFGVQGVTLAVILLASTLVLFIQSRQILWLLLPACLFVIGYGLQTQRWTTEGDEVDFALVQGNIAQSLKWDPNNIKPTLVRYLDLTRANNDADIVVWPESAIPALENEMREFMINIDDAMRSQHIGFITGIQYYDQSEDHYYNAVIGSGLIDKEGQQTYQYGQKNRWYKAHLVPIGEFVPFGDLLRPIAPFFNMPMSSFNAGNAEQPNIISKGYRFATAICYETEFSEEMRKNIHPDTQFIVNVSNDSWFGSSDGPLQHMEIARMRAIEFGKPLLRSTNSGVTVAFDGQGKTLGEIPQFKASVLRVKAKATTGITPYTQWGSMPLIGFCFLSLIAGMILRRK